MRSLRTLAALAVVLIPLSACTPMDDILGDIFGRNMRDQRSFDPYENPRPAPVNSVPFAAGNFAAANGDVNLGQPVGASDIPPPFTSLDVLTQQPHVVGLVNPVEPTAENLARGQVVFERNCAVCHGPDGAGTTCYISEAGFPCAFPLITDAVRGYADGYIYGIIRVGRGIMPPYGHAVTHYDRWNVINYIRQLQDAAVAAQSAAAAGQSDE